jgi:DNA anti-recombination protein RmuC
MSSGEENNRIENAPRSAYDGRTEMRFAAMDKRIAAVEVDVAVIRTSFATKDDVQRVIAILHEHKLEFTNGFACPRDDFHIALATHRDEFNQALAQHRADVNQALTQHRADFTQALTQHRADFTQALAQHRADFNQALAQHNEKFSAALAQHGEKFSAALAEQNEKFGTALAKQSEDLHKTLINHIWKFYGFAALLATAAYYVARSAH